MPCLELELLYLVSSAIAVIGFAFAIRCELSFYQRQAWYTRYTVAEAH